MRAGNSGLGMLPWECCSGDPDLGILTWEWLTPWHGLPLHPWRCPKPGWTALGAA